MKSKAYFEQQWRARPMHSNVSKREAWAWFQIGRSFGDKELQRRQSENARRRAEREKQMAAEGRSGL